MLSDRVATGLDNYPQHRVWYFDGPEPSFLIFSDLKKQINTTADRLASWGLSSPARVGLLAPNSLEWVVHDLALLRLGVTSVAFPHELSTSWGELHERYDLDLLLVSSQDEQGAQQAVGPVAFLDGGERQRPALEPRAVRSADSGDSPLSVTFSSGTSGALKTLKVSDLGTRSIIERFQSLFPFERDDFFLVFLPLSSYQQRVMVYGSILYGIDFAIVAATQLFKALHQLQPTLCLAPPILFENIHSTFQARLEEASWWKQLAFRTLTGIARFSPPALRKKLLRKAYEGVYDVFGDRIRLLWTGMAPIRLSTLEFFARVGMPLYEAYGLNECGPIAANTPDAQRLGSVGRPILPGSVEIADDGEILVSIPHPVTTGYENCQDVEEKSVYLPDGRIATGDLGYLDEDGFLYLEGRKKQLIVTSGGQKISPEILEKRLLELPGVAQACVFGKGLPGLAAVLVLSEGEPAHREDSIRAAVEALNDDQPPHFAIDHVLCTEKKFSRENGLLTRNLKMDRQAIFDEFRDALRVPEPGTRERAMVTS